MASRFNNIQQDQYQALPQYIPMPLDEISNMAKDYSTRYRQGTAIKSQLDLLASKVKAAPHDYALKDQYLKDAHDEFNKLLEGNPDYASPEFQENARTVVAKYANDPRLNTIATNEQTFKDMQKYREQNPKDLIHTYSLSDPNDPNAHPTGYNQNTKGEVMQPRITKYADLNEVAGKSISGIAESGYLTEGGYDLNHPNKTGPNGELLVYDKKSQGYHGVTPEKLQQVAEMLVPVVAQSTAGDYAIRKAMIAQGFDPNEVYNWDYDRLKRESAQGNQVATAFLNDVHDEVYNSLIRTGAKQVGGTSTNKVDQHFVTDKVVEDNALNKNKQVLGTSRNTEGINNPVSPMVDMGLEFGDNGYLKVPTKATTVGKGKAPIIEQDLKKLADQTAYIDAIRKAHPALKDLTPKGVMDAYNKAFQSISNEQLSLNSVSNVASDNIIDGIVRDKKGRSFYIMDGEGTTKDGALSSVLKELDLSEKEFNETISKGGIAGITPDGDTPGAVAIEVMGKNNKSRRVVVSPNNEIAGKFKTSFIVNKARRSLVESVVQPYEDSPNNKLHIVPNIDANGTASWKYEWLIKDPNTGQVQVVPTDMESLKEAERQSLIDSGYLGTDITVLKPHTTQ